MFDVEINAWIAFSAGVLSFFSPCMLPLIPAYVLYIADLDQFEEVAAHKGRVLIRTLAFIAGFTAVFLLFGFSASAIGKVFAANRLVFMKVSGAVLFIFGIYLMGLLPIKAFGKTMRMNLGARKMNFVGAFLMGVVFAAGWTPCFGPVLASILVLASGESTVASGMGMLGLYSLGMAIPFILTALFIVPVSRLLSKVEGAAPVMVKVGGAILALTGILIFFNQLSRLFA